MASAEETDVTARLLWLAQRAPRSSAILAPGRMPLSFDALARHVERTAVQLAGWGIGRGDIVVWANGDRSETAVALATLPASSTIASLNPAATYDSLRHAMARMRPKAVVVPAVNDSAVARAARVHGIAEITTARDAAQGAGAFELMLSRPTPSLDAERRVSTEWMGLGVTSGSTGRPKIVSYGHRQVVATALFTGERLGLDSSDVSGHLMPLHLAGGIRNAFFQPLLNGAAVNVLPQGDVEAFIRATAAGEVTWTSSSFTMLRELLASLEGGRRFERGRLRYVRVASGRLEASEMDRLEQLLGVPVITGLASSETGSTAQQGLQTPRKRGSVGPPVNTEVRLVDEDGHVVGPGDVGEIQVRGPQLFDGYFDDPGLNAASFVDGWFRMGDLARLDEDGEIHLFGRVKEIINRGGDKIAPLEIDAMLRAIPGVADAAAFGIPHPRLGEEVVAAVVAAPGARLSEADIRRRARDVLGANRAPRRIWLVDTLPRSDGGKLRRYDLPAWVGHDAAPPAVPPSPVPGAASAIETALAALWGGVLRLSPVPRDGDFFMLGGDSLRGAQLLEQVQAVFGVAIALDALFDDAGTLAAMAARIEEERTKSSETGTAATRAIIPRRTADGPLPLSSAQLRAWFLQRLDPSSTAYNEARLWRIDGPLDVAALRAALAVVYVRQPMLRTRFVVSGADPRQEIDPEPHVDLEIVALPGAPDDDDERVERAARDRTERVFDLAARPPVRWTLFELGDHRHALLRVWHHILGDGLSAALLQREVSHAYATVRAGHPVQRPPLPVDYADYALWLQDAQRSDTRADGIAWWKARLDELPVLALAPDFRRPPRQSFRGGVVAARLDSGVAASLKAVGRAHRASAFVAFLAAFAALLSRLSGDDDIAIGTPVAGRPLPELADIIGYFANTLVFRADVCGGSSTADLLARTRDGVRDMLSHEHVLFEEVVEALKPPRDPSRNPLFQVAFALRERDAVELHFPDTRVRRVSTGSEHAKFDLTLSMLDGPEGIDARWEFCADVFERATIERMARQYATLVAAMASAPDAPIATLPLMDDATRKRVLAAATATGRAFPSTTTIHRRFTEQARARPDAIAVDALDYAGLDAVAGQLAAELRSRGVATGSTVAVARRRAADIAVAWLGVLKAGAAYLPIDLAVPPARAAFILADAGVVHAIADEALVSLFTGCGVSVVQPERDGTRIAAHPTAAEEVSVGSDSAAYVIYTSGSTGTPKGVVIPHRAVLRLVCDTDCAQIRSDDVVAQIANPAFDASTFEFWGALLNGARIVSIPKTTAIAPRALAAAIAREKVSALFLTTALFNSVASEAPDAFASCRCVLFGGEAVEPDRVAAVVRAGPPRHLIHVYGPTETTTFATWHEVRNAPVNAATVPIGRPLANTDVHVLRGDFEPAAFGEPGEICIAGPGLAKGYLNSPELTGDRFVERAVAAGTKGLLYRSGDRGRRRDDGSIEFLGRRDRQVKIRGHRIELAEVEAAIALLPQVRAAAVAVKGDTAETRKLVACVVSRAASGPPPSNLWSELRTRLPEYALPSQIVWVPALPLNASGKVDRSALLSACESAPGRGAAHVPPRDMFEHVLARIWQDLLHIEEIGVFDRFFDHGGDSLSAVRLVNAIERETGLAAPLTALFVDDTIAGLARVLRDGAADLHAPIVSINGDGALPPFVFLHGDFTGGGFYSRALAHALGREQPVLIVHPHGLVDPTIPETIEAMAADRVAALRGLRPHGPYVLGGHCNGAVVAFEMARQLIGQGEHVPAVVVIEARAPGGNAAAGPEDAGVYMAIERGGLRVLAPRDRETDARLRYQRAIDAYAGGRCATHLVIARSARLKDARRDLGWSRLARSLEVHDLPGDHVTLITRHVGELSQVVRDSMDRALENAAIAP